MGNARLGDFLAKKARGILPSKTPDKLFELYSVPAFEGKRPEIVNGAAIGSNKQIVDPGTVLLCKINPRINRAWTVGSFSSHQKIASTEWITFPPHPDVKPKYLAHYLSRREIRDYLAANASGVGGSLMRVKASTVEDLHLPLPSVDEQHRIVAEIEKQFSRLDEAVTNLGRVKATLNRYKMAVLKAAVEGRLVPTEVELARREGRTYETGDQVLRRVLDARRSQWKRKGKYKEPDVPDTSAMPELPEGWASATLDQLAAKITDGTHRTPDYVPTGIAFVSVKDVRDGAVHFDDTKFISSAEHADLIRRCDPERGDVLITKSGTIGRTAVVTSDRPFSLFVSVALIKPVKPHVNPRFLKIALDAYIQTIDISQDVKGGLLKNLHLEDLRVIRVPFPPLREQQRIVAEAERRLTVVESTTAELDKNTLRGESMRTAILTAAFETPNRDSEGGPMLRRIE